MCFVFCSAFLWFFLQHTITFVLYCMFNELQSVSSYTGKSHIGHDRCIFFHTPPILRYHAYRHRLSNHSLDKLAVRARCLGHIRRSLLSTYTRWREHDAWTLWRRLWGLLQRNEAAYSAALLGTVLCMWCPCVCSYLYSPIFPACLELRLLSKQAVLVWMIVSRNMMLTLLQDDYEGYDEQRNMLVWLLWSFYGSYQAFPYVWAQVERFV